MNMTTTNGYAGGLTSSASPIAASVARYDAPSTHERAPVPPRAASAFAAKRGGCGVEDRFARGHGTRDLLSLNSTVLLRFERQRATLESDLARLATIIARAESPRDIAAPCDVARGQGTRDALERAVAVEQDDAAVLARLLRARAALLDKSRARDSYVAKSVAIVDDYRRLMNECVIAGVASARLDAIKEKLYDRFARVVRDVADQMTWTDVSASLSDDVCVRSRSNAPSTAVCEYCQRRDTNESTSSKRSTCSACAREKVTIEMSTSACSATSAHQQRASDGGGAQGNRILHFQDCVRQFQGIPTCKLPQSVLDALTAKFSAYNLLVDSDATIVRYSKITPQHITFFLKELKLTKQYENVNVIYYTLTGKRVADIRHLETRLVDDVKQLVALYDHLHGKDRPQALDRKNFMNVQYLLFQLLRRHGYACKIEDFSVIKTADRKLFYDGICGNLFKQLGWNFTPTF
jgi:Poxvirus Late Transcription Factor VLTF3 like